MKRINIIYIIKFCLRSAWKSSKTYTILRVFIKVLLPIATLLMSYISASITNTLAGQKNSDRPERTFLILMLLLVGMKVLSMILNKVHSFIAQNHNELLDNDINLSIMDVCNKSDLEMFDNPLYYDRLELARRDSQSIVNILWSVLDFVCAALSFLSIFIVVCSKERIFALVITVSIIPTTIISHYFTKKNYSLRIKQTNEEREKYYYAAISTEKSYSQIIRINNMGDWLKKKYHDLWRKLFLQRKALYQKNYIFETVVNIIPEFVVIGALISIGMKVFHEDYLIGDYVLYTGLFSQLYSQITLTIENAMTIYDNKMKIENILAFNNTPNTIFSGECPLESIDSIEFRNVCFRYPASDVDVLSSVSFKINKGEKIALVGVNGSGKTTLLKLMLRFYDPTYGEILINGMNIKSYKIDDIRSCVDCYFQNSINLPFSLRKNINIRNEEKLDRNIDADIGLSMEQAHAKDILLQSEGDLSRHISRLFSKTGMELSEGQHQKIAIARVFYSNKQFVLFDEPSSSLDPEAEDHVFKSIEKLFYGKTVFFTSHRLTNLFLADRIIVLEDGKIIESGTKNELLNMEKRFFDLYHYQAEKFADNEHNQ